MPIHRRPTRSAVAGAHRLRRDSTHPEQVLWSVLRAHQVAGAHFRRQYPVEGFVLDFACASLKLGVELDGISHVGRADQDEARSARLQSRGWRIVRFTNDDVLADRFVVAEAIEQIVVEMGSTPSEPPPAGEGSEKTLPGRSSPPPTKIKAPLPPPPSGEAGKGPTDTRRLNSKNK